MGVLGGDENQFEGENKIEKSCLPIGFSRALEAESKRSATSDSLRIDFLEN